MPYGNSNNIGSLYQPPSPQQSGNPATNPNYTVNSPGSQAPFTQQGQGSAFSPTQADANGNLQDQTGGKMTTQQGQVYGNLYGQAQGMSGYFNNLAAGYSQNAPQIGDASQLAAAQDYYSKLMQGDGGYAQNQFRQSQDQSIAAQMAMANSARGGAAARAGAQRAAMQGAGQQMAGGANQAAQIAMQEEQQGAQGMTQLGTLELQRNQQNAALQQNNQQQINQMQTALWGMGEQEQQMSASDFEAYMANLLGAEGVQAQQSQQNVQTGMQVAGAGLQAVSGGIGAAVSDANYKTDIQSQGRGGGIGSVDYAQPTSTSNQGDASSIGALSPTATQPQMQGRENVASLYSRPLNSQPQVHALDNSTQVGVGAGVGAAAGAASGASAGPVGSLVGAAGGALQGGLGAAAQTRKNDEGLKAANTAASTGIGAAAGAAGGSAFGPWGTAIGAGVGAVGGLIKGLLT